MKGFVKMAKTGFLYEKNTASMGEEDKIFIVNKGQPDIRSSKEIEIRETKGLKVYKIYEFKILFLIQRQQRKLLFGMDR